MEQFWNAQRQQILAAVPADFLAPVFEAGQGLHTVATQLQTAAEALRQRLVEMFGIVAGPPEASSFPESF
jgi:hypothetical protein